jgi:DAACS family dicarboxylate/amino acid:cation (Na+ or H+) symporter
LNGFHCRPPWRFQPSPAESVGIILGVDRLFDMSRTVVDVEGDLVAAVVVNRYEAR